MTASKRKPRSNAKRRGRPSRAQASAKALSAVDVSKIDPRAVLQAIAADPSAAATARVQACKVLMGGSGGDEKPKGDPVAELAVRLLRGGK